MAVTHCRLPAAVCCVLPAHTCRQHRGALDPGELGLTSARACWQEDGEDHKHDERVTSVSIEVEGQLHPEAINMWLQVRPSPSTSRPSQQTGR